jgi:hypothetical protein
VCSVTFNRKSAFGRDMDCLLGCFDETKLMGWDGIVDLVLVINYLLDPIGLSIRPRKLFRCSK